MSARWNRHHYQYKETIVTLLCSDETAPAGWQAICDAREILEHYIARHPEFAESHQPIDVIEDMPDLVRQMVHGAVQAGVGPMAAVAGTLARAGVDAMRKAGASEALVDNGGDIALWIHEPVLMGIYSGSKSHDLAFDVQPRDTVFGICTSSGTIGPSYSYGKSDAAIVISENVSLADAAATALGNRVKPNASLDTVFDFMEDNDAIDGAAVIAGERIALWGDLPMLVQSDVDLELITRGR